MGTFDQSADFSIYDAGGHVHNVQNQTWGATGDGATDDRAAISAADSAAGSSGVLYFPAGTYVIATSLTISAPVQLAPGATLKPSSGATLTITEIVPGQGLWQIFDESAGGDIALAEYAAESVYPEWWGAKSDMKYVSDAAITASDKTLTSATGLFEASDVGKTIVVQGAGAAGVPLKTTIASFTSTSEVELTAAASTTVPNGGLPSPEANWLSDDTTPVQRAIDEARAARCTCEALGVYGLTATVVLGSGYEWGFTHRPGGNRWDRGINSGFVWIGSDNDVMVEMQEQKGSWFGWVVCNNRIAEAAGITGFLAHNGTGGTPPLPAGSHWHCDYLGLHGLATGLQIGDYTNDGYDSNVESGQIDQIHMYDTDDCIVIDSDDQDLIRVSHFESGGHPSGRSRSHILHAKRNGNCLKVEFGFARVDDIVADNAALRIDDGAFSCDKFSLEGPASILGLWINESPSRDQSVIQGLVMADGIRDSSGRAAIIGAKGGAVLVGCTWSGDVQLRYPTIDMGSVFQGSYGFDDSPTNGRLISLGPVRERATAASAISVREGSFAELGEGVGAERFRVGDVAGMIVKSVLATADLVSGTPYTIASLDVDPGDSWTVIVEFNLYRVSTVTRNLSAGGRIIYNVHADSAGNEVVGTPDIVVVKSQGAEYSSFTVTAGTAVTGGSPDVVDLQITQTNAWASGADAMRASFLIRFLGNQGASNDVDFGEIA